MRFSIRPDKVPYSVPVPNNMGLVRYVLAFAVIVSHFNILTGSDLRFPIDCDVAVGGFFALSGFLVYGGYLRKANLRHYVVARMVRLLPAYFSAVVLFAVLLAAVSSRSPGDYFLSGHFVKYLVSNLFFLNFIEPALPGVFSSFDIPAVNGSLWTMKVEWLLCLSVPLVAWLVRKARGRATPVFVAVVLVSVAYRVFFHELYCATGRPVYSVLSRQFLGLMAFFYCGVLLYYWYGTFRRFKWPLMAAALLAFAFKGTAYNYDILVCPAAFAVLVVGFSMTGTGWGRWEAGRDNLSYNMYLLHFPVVQLAAFFRLPQLVGPALSLCLVLLVVLGLSAAVSAWVERPVMKYYRQRCRP